MSSLNIMGYSALGLPIEMHSWTALSFSAPHVLILGGVHGDEIEGVTAALGLLRELQKNELPVWPFHLHLIPRFNVDGVLLKARSNFNGVDLNRNLPTKDWTAEAPNPRYQPGSYPLSEPENQALVRLLEELKPALIISLHSWYPVLNVNGDCLHFAELLAQRIGYRIDTDIGYPTPGSLGTYAGLERGWPTLTYELERGIPLPEILRTHVPAILSSLREWSRA